MRIFTLASDALRPIARGVRFSAAALALTAALAPVACKDAADPLATAPRAPTAQVQSTATTSATPTLPRKFVNITMPVTTGNVIRVRAGGDLQAALNTARGGDAIELVAGATYYGPIVLPARADTGWVVIRSSTSVADMPAPGRRVSPVYAAKMPKIVSRTYYDRALATAPTANHYRLIGIEIAVDPSVASLGTLVELGDASSAQNSLALVPHHIILDRMYIHGSATLDLRRCVGLQSAYTAIIDSYISECHSVGYDAQAVAGWNGPGPFLLKDNFLSAAAENLLFGGGDPAIALLTPSDIVVRGNYFYKPLSWRGSQWLVKNLFEIKNGQRILVEGNSFNGSWRAGQAGFGMNWKSENQDGTAPWSICQDVTFRYNRVRNVGGAVSMTGSGATNPINIPARRVLIQDNIFDSVAVANYDGEATFYSVQKGPSDIQWIHNTMVSPAPMNTAMVFDIAPSASELVMRDNIVMRGEYGVKGGGVGEGIPTLNLYAPGWNWTGNVLIGSTSSAYPIGTAFTASTQTIGFVNLPGGDYHLAATSPYKNTASDGRDPGADVDMVMQKTARAEK